MVNMDGMLSLFETVAQSDCHNVLLQTFLKTCTEHQAFVTKVTHFLLPHAFYGAFMQGSFNFGVVYEIRCYEILNVNINIIYDR